jgi:hypothetical protein
VGHHNPSVNFEMGPLRHAAKLALVTQQSGGFNVEQWLDELTPS